MRKPTFVEMNAFIALADHLSLAKAAVQVGVSTSMLSETIRTLQERLGVQLIERVDRGIALTESGQQLARTMRPILQGLDAALKEMAQANESPKGSIKIVTWGLYARRALAPLLPQFQAEFPDTAIEISCVLVPDKADLVGSNFDLGIDFAERIARDMIAIRLTGKRRTVILGSPAYFAQHPPPRAPKDLKGHNCIRLRLPDGTTLPWRIRKNGKSSLFTVDGKLIFTDARMQLQAAIDGLGLCFGTYAFFENHILDGSLIEVMRDWSWESNGFFLYYSSKRQTPVHVQSFVDFMRRHSQKSGSWLPEE